MTPRCLWLINYINHQRMYNTNPVIRLQRWGLGLWFRIRNQSRSCTKLPLKDMATLLKMFPQRLIFIVNWYIDVLWIISTLFCWGPASTVGWGGGDGRQHPIYYIIISHDFGSKWVKYSILWCQPCPNSFIWTYFHIAYTNKTKLSDFNYFLNMTDFDTYR